MLLEKMKQALAGLVEQPPVLAEEPAAAPPEEIAAPSAPETEGKAAKPPKKKEEPPPPPPPPLHTPDYKSRGWHLDVSVASDKVVEATEIIDREGFTLEAVTGVDWLADGQMEVVYDYSHVAELCRIVVRTRVDRNNPEVPTIAGIYPGANWHERETHDFFGIVFTGHPNLEPLLLPEDADFHPLRKDYTP